jgi:predicted nucleic acid-binding protein
VVVIDGSALVVAVTDTTPRGAVARVHLVQGASAPHLVDAEVGQGIRGLVLRGLLTDEQAQRSLAAAEQLVTDRYPHSPLHPRAWELRNNVSYYDALYVSLAERAGVPLVTADVKLANANGPRCQIELV